MSTQLNTLIAGYVYKSWKRNSIGIKKKKMLIVLNSITYMCIHYVYGADIFIHVFRYPDTLWINRVFHKLIYVVESVFKLSNQFCLLSIMNLNYYDYYFASEVSGNRYPFTGDECWRYLYLL